MPDIFVGESKHNKPEAKENTRDNIVAVGPTHVKPASTHHKHNHLIAAYCDHPNAVKVANILADEEILLFLRKHFITNFPWIIKGIGFMLIIPLLIFLNSSGLINLISLPFDYVLFFIIFYCLMIFTYMFLHYLSWFYNISLVTTRRIIDIDFSSLVYENVSATKLPQLEDVSYSQVGIIRSIFDYGDVILQTAGTVSGFDFLAVPHPEKVIKIVNGLIGKPRHA